MSEIWTVGRLLEWTTSYFAERGIESPKRDAEHLLAHAIGLSRLQLYTGYDRPLVASELAVYRALVARRAKHEPVAYLLGRKGFHEIDLKVDKRVLIPRPETELVVERARLLKPRRILDVGTGSGAIALALLYVLPEATAVATDVSADALDVARENAELLKLSDRVEFRQGSFFEPVHGEAFDVVVSNPPYIAEGLPLMADVAEYEPHLALFSGPDGTHALRVLLQQMPPAAFVYELGYDQGEAMCAFAKQLGYSDVQLHKDANGIGRVLEGKR